MDKFEHLNNRVERLERTIFRIQVSLTENERKRERKKIKRRLTRAEFLFKAKGAI